MIYQEKQRVVYKHNGKYFTGVIWSYYERIESYYLLPDKNDFDFKLFVSEQNIIGVTKSKAYHEIPEDKLKYFLEGVLDMKKKLIYGSIYFNTFQKNIDNESLKHKIYDQIEKMLDDEEFKDWTIHFDVNPIFTIDQFSHVLNFYGFIENSNEECEITRLLFGKLLKYQFIHLTDFYIVDFFINCKLEK